MKVIVGAWVGAGNLGDELLLVALLRLLRARRMTPLVLSLDPAATRRLHGIDAIGGHQLPAAIRGADGFVFGGGGLVQDETSIVSPLYQLHRPVLAHLGRLPVVGVGLGAGPLRAWSSRWLTRRALAPALGIAVRDEGSREALYAAGLRDIALAADLAFTLPPPPPAPVGDEVVVALRPRFPAGGLVPGRLRRRQPDQARFVAATAEQLDRIVATVGGRVRLLSMEPSRDDPLHHAIAARMSSAAVFEPVGLAELLPTIAGARLVIASRYHGAVTATLAGRPTVMLGYAPKVRELARELGPAGIVLEHATVAVGGLSAAAERAMRLPHEAIAAGRRRLMERARVNDVVLGRLVAAR